jgi:acetyltransferase-like isoleucine patch superfamily enzyme
VKENAYIDAYGGFIRVGRGGALAQATVIHGNGGVEIGDYLMMGHGAMILAGNHNHTLADVPFLFQGSTTRGITLGNNVWLGAGAIILDGSSIGHNVVIGAGAVVAGHVPENSIVIGSRELILRPLGQVG